MFTFAWKSLWQEKGRLAMSVGGIAAAILLILIMNGVFAGAAQKATAYIDKSGADIYVMQRGVSNMHMASSVLPGDFDERLEKVEGVKVAVGIAVASTSIQHAQHRIFTSVIGYDPGAPLGGPWKMAEGTRNIGADEAIVDVTFARENGFGLGDRVNIMNRTFKIAGLSEETLGLASSMAFIRDTSLARIDLAPAARNYFLVETDNGVSVKTVTERIKEEFPQVNALTRAQFSDSDRRMILQMGIDIIRAMSAVSFLIGAVVVALTIYNATLGRLREFGVLKAIGAGMDRLYRAVFQQAFVSALLGLAVGFLLSFITVSVVNRVFPDLFIVLDRTTIIRVTITILVISLVASWVPVRRIANVDPTIVFKA